MSIDNLSEVEEWFRDMRTCCTKLIRFKNFPASRLNMSYEKELKKHAENYLINNRDQTFHHIRLLFKDMARKKIELPLVGVYMGDHIHISPGGSRLMVAKHMGIETVPLDLIVDYTDECFVDWSLEHSLIEKIDDFLEPYNNINAKIHFQFKNESDDENDRIQSFWYQPNYQPHWHWTADDVDAWLKLNSDKRCDNLIDYYFL